MQFSPKLRRAALVLPAGVLAAALLAQTGTAPRAETADLIELPPSFSPLVEKVQPAVVTVSTRQQLLSSTALQDDEDGDHEEQRRGRNRHGHGYDHDEGRDHGMRDFMRRFFGDDHDGRRGHGGRHGGEERRFSRGIGSGFVVDAEGYVVTNAHVVRGADKVTVTFHDGAEMAAEVVGRDRRSDLALLKVDSGSPLATVEWGESDEVKVGDWVVAVGNPFGLGGTVTAGVVSARGRDLPGGSLVDFMQIDAPINRGNSGGPTFNAKGQVIGVNTAIYSPNGGSVGIGFAIPSSDARDVIAELRDKGYVERGWLGVRIQPITEDLAAGLGLDEDEGALVASVEPDSPAAAAGLRSGDVVTAWDGTEIEDPRDLFQAVAATDVGKSVTVAVMREGAARELTVETGEAPRRQAALDGEQTGEKRGRALGVAVAKLTPELRRDYGIDAEAEGLVVLRVKPGSPAARQGLRPGDVIAGVGGEAIAEPDALRDAVKAARQDERRALALQVLRDGESRFLAVPLGKRRG